MHFYHACIWGAMSEIIDEVERRRLESGLSQAAVAMRLGISQPHYSKVVGGVVALTDHLVGLMAAWLKANPVAVVHDGDRRDRIRMLSRSIERDLRQLNRMLAEEGRGPGRRGPRPTRVRRQTSHSDR